MRRSQPPFSSPAETGGTISEVTPQVSDIVLDRSSHLQVSYDDGVEARFAIEALRQRCPCATCRSRRERGLEASSASQVEAVDADLHGNWGIAIRWTDGHDTGIYSWRQLREWWEHAAGTARDDHGAADDGATDGVR